MLLHFCKSSQVEICINKNIFFCVRELDSSLIEIIPGELLMEGETVLTQVKEIIY